MATLQSYFNLLMRVFQGSWGTRRRVNRSMQILRSVMIYSPNPPLKSRPESEIRQICLHAKSKIRAQNIDESAIRCNCRIRKSVKIILSIRNPGKNIFKLRRSVRLFTPLNKGALTKYRTGEQNCTNQRMKTF